MSFLIIRVLINWLYNRILCALHYYSVCMPTFLAGSVVKSPYTQLRSLESLTTLSIALSLAQHAHIVAYNFHQ